MKLFFGKFYVGLLLVNQIVIFATAFYTLVQKFRIVFDWRRGEQEKVNYGYIFWNK